MVLVVAFSDGCDGHTKPRMVRSGEHEPERGMAS
jgi:hypothetical protein